MLRRTECGPHIQPLYAMIRLLTFPEKPRNARNTEYQLKNESVLTSSNKFNITGTSFNQVLEQWTMKTIQCTNYVKESN
jgi:surface antigen